MGILIFGSGDCGQLALDEDTWSQEKPIEHPFFAQKNITQIAAGGLHTLALSADGQVYSWGCNDEKALGHNAPEFSVGQVTSGLEGIKVIQVAAGDSISAALTGEGLVYTWGTFRDSKGLLGHLSTGKRSRTASDSELKVELMQERPVVIPGLTLIRSIIAGSNNLFAIDQLGQVFSWGCGEQGQLGRRVLERHKHLGLRPANVTPRSGRHHIPIVKVAPGSYHTLFLSQTGQVYVVGHNNFGQLGTGDLEPVATPLLISLPEVMVDASAGEHHSLLLGKSGRIYAAGRNDSGELGIPQVNIQSSVFLPITSDLPQVIKIASGGHHNLAITASDAVYAWGYGEMHQLGLGHDQIIKAPALVTSSGKVKAKPVQVACGAQHSLILTN